MHPLNFLSAEVRVMGNAMDWFVRLCTTARVTTAQVCIDITRAEYTENYSDLFPFFADWRKNNPVPLEIIPTRENR